MDIEMKNEEIGVKNGGSAKLDNTETDIKVVVKETNEVVVKAEAAEIAKDEESTEKQNKNKSEEAPTQVEETVKSENGAKFDTSDQYGYTKSNLFTSEIFKIEIKNIPKHYGYGNWKKLFKNKLKIKAHKIQVIKNINKVYVTFMNHESRELALEKLNGMEIKGCILSAKKAQPKKDAMAKKRGAARDGDEVDSKQAKLDQNPEEVLKDSLIPWWNMDYKEQLKEKQQSVIDCLTDFHKFLSSEKNIDKPIFHWLMNRKFQNNGVLCPVEHILASPMEDEYRNKCNFTIGLNLSGEIVVGNRLGKYRNQMCAVESPACLKHVPQEMKAICENLQEFIRSTKYTAYDRQTFEGNWQEVMIRNNRQKQHLVVVKFCRHSLTDEEVKEVSDKLKQHVEDYNNKEAAATAVKIDTLLFAPTQVRTRNDDESNWNLLIGDGCIFEELCGYQFRISPTAFFQCNTYSAEVLYKAVEELANEGRDMESRDPHILLDVCCGTGTIGISMSKNFSKIYGIDICEAAIKDARKNAELNEITNVEFHVGKAEDEIHSILRSLPKDANVVAVVDPPRCGVHPKVISAIRNHSKIETLVYVSCSITQTRQNVNDLTRNASKRLQGTPFEAVKCRPVDLFPHTKHVEVITVYKRLKVDEDSAANGTDAVNKTPQEKQQQDVDAADKTEDGMKSDQAETATQ